MVSFADDMLHSAGGSICDWAARSPDDHLRILGQSKEIFLLISMRSHGALPVRLKNDVDFR